MLIHIYGCLCLLSVCVYVSFLDNKSAPPNIPGASVRSTNELWKQCSVLDVAKQMVITPKENTIIFYSMESSQQNILWMFQKGGPFCVYNVYITYTIFVFFFSRTNRKRQLTKYSDDRMRVCVCVFMIFSLNLFFFFLFESDAKG